jgi:glycosyltransferase involved in cell wall biosynthesis
MSRIVAYLPAWLDACALFRMFLPHLHTPRSKFLFNIQALPLEDFADASVVVVQRQCTESNVKALKRFRELGIKIVYDLDDNLWNLTASNPSKRVFDTMRQGFAECIALCDILTVSTEGLATGVRTHYPTLRQEIVVVPNAIDFALLHPSVLPKGEGTVVGYAGTNTHMGDVYAAWEAITELVLENDLSDTRFEFVGMPPPKKTVGHPLVKTRDFVPVSEFFARFSSWAWDVSLAPLEETRFNHSKSAIKIYEAAAVGIPILVSPVGPYAEFCALDSELSYLQCSSRTQWKTKIKELAAEPERRDYYAQRMKKVVEDHFDIRKVAHQWEAVFDRVS